MEQLSVIGLEDDQLIVESQTGQRFSIAASAIPDIRRVKPQATSDRKTTPREIQTLMRAGASAEDVAAQTGEELEYVRRFETPVIAERQHVLDMALAVPVSSGDIDPLAKSSTFGAALTERLTDIGATNQTWFAAKETTGEWTVRLTFTTQGAERTAHWSFAPRKGQLTPNDKEATALSQQDDASSVLVPRLRAVDPEAARPTPPSSPSSPASAPASSALADTDAAGSAEQQSVDAGSQASSAPGARFDSGAFQFRTDERPSKPVTPNRISLSTDSTQPAAVQDAAISTAKPAIAPNHTADLLEALRKRRGEREAALAQAERPAEAAAESGKESEKAESASGVHHTSPLTQAKPKRGGRAAMPSWDEIVFGAKNDE